VTVCVEEKTMTYYGSKQLADAFRTVRKNTIVIGQDIPEDKYTFSAAPNTRTVSELLIHLAVSPSWQHELHSQRVPSLAGYDFAGRFSKDRAQEQIPRTKAQMLERSGEAFASFLEALSEDALAEMVAMPGNQPPKSRFEMLLSVKEHEMHHRGQLMVIERHLGIVPHLTREREARFAATTRQPAQA
jgi:uncharacterized damage-inducible protein DinB